MAIRLQIRRDTSSNWSTNNPILQVGEFGFDTTVNRFKVGIASDSTSRWNALSYLNVIPSELKELAQDFVEEAITAGTGITKTYNDSANTLTIAVDSTIANKTYVDTAVSGLSNTAADTYIPISLYGNADGVATLDADGYVPQSQLTNTLSDITDYVDGAVAGVVNSAPATLNTLKELSDALGADANFATTTATALGTKITATSQDTLRNKTISISNGITSVSGYDTITGFYGQSNIPILQDGIDKGGKINISSGGVITVASSGLGYTSGIAIIGGGTRILIEIAGNNLTGTKAQFNAAMTDADFVTLAGTEELTNKTLNSPIINQPTGLVKGDVGLANVDNTSDNTKALLSYISEPQLTRTINSSTDKNKMIECSVATVVTIPNDTQDSGWQVGSMVEIRQVGTGQVTITKDAAVTMVGTDSQFKSRVQWSTIMLEKRSANSWLVTGDTTA
jgi:hypothetical protein